MNRPSMEQLRKALQAMHHYAIGESDRPYMSIPARPDHDADLLLAAALDELEQLRARFSPDCEAGRLAGDVEAGVELANTGGTMPPLLGSRA